MRRFFTALVFAAVAVASGGCSTADKFGDAFAGALPATQEDLTTLREQNDEAHKQIRTDEQKREDDALAAREAAREAGKTEAEIDRAGVEAAKTTSAAREADADAKAKADAEAAKKKGGGEPGHEWQWWEIALLGLGGVGGAVAGHKTIVGAGMAIFEYLWNKIPWKPKDLNDLHDAEKAHAAGTPPPTG